MSANERRIIGTLEAMRTVVGLLEWHVKRSLKADGQHGEPSCRWCKARAVLADTAAAAEEVRKRLWGAGAEDALTWAGKWPSLDAYREYREQRARG